MYLDSTLKIKAFKDSHLAESIRELGYSYADAESNLSVLDEESLSLFWMNNFRNSGAKRRVPDDWWGFHCARSKLNISFVDFLDPTQIRLVREKLRQRMRFEHNERVCFFGGVEVVICDWQSFLKYWNAFVDLEDEGILVSTKHDYGMLLSPMNSFIEIRR